jgi:hypothetical protein
VIRLTCPNCARESLQPDALAGVPLLCKGCGHRLEATPVKDEPPPAFDRSLEPPPIRDVPPPTPKPRTESFQELDLDHALRNSLAMIQKEDAAAVPKPQPLPSEGPVDDAKRKWKSRAGDAAAILVLLLIGVLLGEFAARKPTSEILGRAATGPKFPPTDLLLWLGSVGSLLLLYAWLFTRGWTLGAWLSRR